MKYRFLVVAAVMILALFLFGEQITYAVGYVAGLVVGLIEKLVGK